MAIVIPKEERDRVVGEYIRLELFIILHDTEGNPYYSYSQLFSTYDLGTGAAHMFCPDIEPDQYKVTEEEFGKKLALARAKAKKADAVYRNFFKFIKQIYELNYMAAKKFNELYHRWIDSEAEVRDLLKSIMHLN